MRPMVAVVCVWASGAVLTASPAPGASTRTVYVTVVDQSGQAVPGLRPADFVIKERGQERAIATVTPATEKMRLALIVADSMVEQPLIASTVQEGRHVPENVPGSVDRTRVRDGLAEFVERLCPSAEIALFTIGLRVEKVVDFTSDPNTLLDVIRQLPRGQAPPIEPSESVLDVARQFEREPPARPVIVVAAPGDFGSANPDYLLSEVAKSKAQVWAVSISSSRTVGPQFDGFHGAGAGDVPRQLGGRHIRMLDLAGFQAGMRQVANDLSSQYRITYTLPDGVKASDRVTVSLKMPGVTLLAPTRVPAR